MFIMSASAGELRMTAMLASGIMACMADEDQHEVELLITALDHAWRWFDLRMTGALQIVNYYLVAAALTSAAYVSALNARNYVVAGTIAIIASSVSLVAYSAGQRQRDIAQFAVDPIREIEDRLAGALSIDSLRMVEHSGHTPRPLFPYLTAHVLYPVGVIIGVAAAIYAWVGA
jgi:hypothetical protein